MSVIQPELGASLHLPPEDPPPGSDARAESLLADYLRQWGLRDPSAIATLCQRWVQNARQMVANDQLAAAALAEAMNEIDHWLDHLALFLSPDPAEAVARRGLLALEVRKIIDDYPQAMLQYESLPEPFLQQLRKAARPVVPTRIPVAQMQGPPLGELPRLLQPHRWRRVFVRVVTGILQVVPFKREKPS